MGKKQNIHENCEDLKDLMFEWYFHDKAKSIRDFIDENNLDKLFTPQEVKDILNNKAYISGDSINALTKAMPFSIEPEHVFALNKYSRIKYKDAYLIRPEEDKIQSFVELLPNLQKTKFAKRKIKRNYKYNNSDAHKKWNEENKDLISEAKKRWLEKNRDKARTSSNEWKKNNAEKNNAARRKRRQQISEENKGKNLQNILSSILAHKLQYGENISKKQYSEEEIKKQKEQEYQRQYMRQYRSKNKTA